MIYPSILTICVNYLNEEDTLSFVNELINLKGYEDGIVIVVVNGEGSQKLKFLKHEKIIIKYPEKNLGYFGGANWAFQEYLKNNPLPNWVIVSNTDISFKDKDFFLKLKKYKETNNLGVIAPNIELVTKSVLPSTYKYQNPYMRFPLNKTKIKILRIISKYYLLYSLYEICSSLKYVMLNKLYNVKITEPIEIYAPFGAFIIFHRNYFEKGGNLNYKNFLYGEEIFVAETCRKLGLKIIYDPHLEIFHYEHGSLKHCSSLQRFYYFKKTIENFNDFLKD